jgi:hypothetical protein
VGFLYVTVNARVGVGEEVVLPLCIKKEKKEIGE